MPFAYTSETTKSAKLKNGVARSTVSAALPRDTAAKTLTASLAPSPQATRKPARSPEILIVGGGMSGMLMAIRLLQAGLRTFKILEKAAKIGGTWRDNTYPGLKCDVPAHMYTYSFESNPDYSQRFAPGSEIQSYLERVCEKYELLPYIQFSTVVDSAVFDQGRWTVRTRGGEVHTADIVITACGILHQPQLPDIPGLESFRGESFHTARWNHDVSLHDKRVAVIGSGSTAVQVVPAIVEQVRHLTLFQRTPQWIFPMPNRRYGTAQQQRLHKFPLYANWLRYAYSKLFQWTFSRAVVGNQLLLKYIQWQCEQHLIKKVKDPDLQRKLRPNYRAGCKRLIFGKGFFQALQHPRASLVTEGIVRVVEDGIITADGQHHALDVIVMATGFKSHNYMRPMRVVGQDGITIDQLWGESPFAYRSVALPGFPNFFTILGPYSPIGNYSVISVAETQVDYVMQLIRAIANGQCDCLAPKADIAQQLRDKMQAAAKQTVWFSGCHSWYFDSQGNLPLWPWTIERYQKEMKRPDFSEFVAIHLPQTSGTQAASSAAVEAVELVVNNSQAKAA